MTAAPAPAEAPARSGRRALAHPWARVGLIAVAACLAWLPFVSRSLSPDEGGFLMVAGQWQPGASLYGDYWVDRPPGLVALFAAADLAGGAWAVRALGLVAVATSVLLAGALGRVVTPHGGRSPLVPAGTAALLLATPLTGAGAVNGELLGLPFVLGGFVALLSARSAPSPARALGWAVAAGAAAAAAALVKQSLLDVFVLAVVVLTGDLLGRRRPWSRVRTVGLGGLTGATGVVAAALLVALARGTGVGELWDAVVVFRAEAARVIVESATGATTTRLGGVLLALVGTGAPLLALTLVRLGRRADRRARLRWAAYAVLAWELWVVLAGGSYWLHYLVGLVPGLVLLAAAASAGLVGVRTPRLVRGAYAVASASTAVAVGWAAAAPHERAEEPATAWLVEHAEPGDTGVVAFGKPNILQAAGLSSPYPHLWSLPARVHDPRLDHLGALLGQPRRPDWLVVRGRSLDTWGIDGRHADVLVEQHYTPAARAGDYVIYRSRDRP